MRTKTGVSERSGVAALSPPKACETGEGRKDSSLLFLINGVELRLREPKAVGVRAPGLDQDL